jgi:hypothetical protein
VLLHGDLFPRWKAAITAMFDYIESFYNRSKASLAGGLLELLRL